MTLQVLIRSYVESDQDAVIAILRDLAASELQVYDRTRPPQEWGPADIEDFGKEIEKSRGERLVAELDGKVIGYVNLHIHRDTEGDQDEVFYRYSYIGDLGVRSEYRSHGVGSLLIARCEEIVRAAGIKWLRLNVLAANTRGRAFYESHGFGEVLIGLEKSL
jgi:ribosomal protein S18 acetylase RimI-like enzyme